MDINNKITKAEYRQRHKVFLEKTNQHAKFCEKLRHPLASALDNIGLNSKQQKRINILSIGSGDGIMDIEILKIVNDEMQRNGAINPIEFFNRVIEPNKTSLSIYKNAVDDLPPELSNARIVFDIDRPKTFEEYMVEVKEPIQFDIVHFIHILYYIDVEKALKHCYEKELGEKGIIICVFAHKNDLMSCLQKEDESSSLPPYDMIKEIISVAEKCSWKYHEYIEEHYYDVSDIFDESSVEGNFLLDFLMLRIDFRSKSNHKIVDTYLDLIKHNSLSKDGKYFAKKVQRIIIINKN